VLKSQHEPILILRILNSCEARGVRSARCAKREVCEARGVRSARCAKREVCEARGVPPARAGGGLGQSRSGRRLKVVPGDVVAGDAGVELLFGRLAHVVDRLEHDSPLTI